MPGPIFRFNDTELDIGRYEIRRNGRTMRLERLPMELLILLASRQGELVTREEVIERLWGKGVHLDADQGINTAIRKIRLCLRDTAENPTYVQTVVGKGYRLIPPVTASQPPAPGSSDEVSPDEVSPRTAAAVPAQISGSISSRFGLRRWIATAAIALASLSAASIWFWFTHREPQAIPIRAMAVLPFENLSGDPAQDYFVDGVTDELITELARMGGVRVISRTSSMQYKHARGNCGRLRANSTSMLS